MNTGRKKPKKETSMAERFKVAVVQAAPVVFDRERTLKKVHALAADAAGQSARLVVFPEAFVSAYPRGLDFGAVFGSRTDKGREQFRRYWESSVDVPGPAVVALGAPDGAYLGKHRKVMPTASERLVWGFGDGSTMPVFDTPLGKVGAVICWENYLPLMRAAMYAKGVELYCAPTADPRDSWIASMRHIAVEGRCFVLSSNQFNRRCDFPSDYGADLGDDPDAIVTRGGSCIVDPFWELSRRTQHRRRGDSDCRDRSRADRSWKVRPRCCGALCPPGYIRTAR